MTAAYTLAGVPLRHEVPTVRQPCACGVAFHGASQAAIDRLYAEHLAEQRNPDAHELEAW